MPPLPSRLNAYEQAIVRNAEWFLLNQKQEGNIDVEGDEFYGLRGDATLVGHSVTVRMYAYGLTRDARYLASARSSLEWLKRKQDARGGWRGVTAFTLDGAQCVFEGFNSYERVTGDASFRSVLVSAARRMIAGTIAQDGRLILPNIIEIGEYAHFCLLAWKTTGDESFQKAAQNILGHIYGNFDEAEGFWNPYDVHAARLPVFLSPLKFGLRSLARAFPLRGRMAAKLASSLLPFVTAPARPQYSMSLMDAEALLDTLDGSCSLALLRKQTECAVEWARIHCKGPFSGSLVESCRVARGAEVYPLSIINDTRAAALWPTTCWLLALCALNEAKYRDQAAQIASFVLGAQGSDGGFYNFRNPDGSFAKLRSGNVNFYASMSLWVYNEVYGTGTLKLFTK